MSRINREKDTWTVMAFGAHPDDVEIGMGGTLAALSRQGHRIFIVDLTSGEMGSNGNPETRLIEASRAARILGITERINLGLRDRGIQCDESSIELVVRVIRDKKPSHIFIPYRNDRHPDHRNAFRLVDEAIMNAGLIRYCPDIPPHRINETVEYFINEIEEPTRFWDIEACTAAKYEALSAYRSQFVLSSEAVPTLLNQGFVERIRIRDAYWGGICETGHAEMFRTGKLAPLQL